MGIEKLKRIDIPIAVITSEKSEIVKKRMSKLKIDYLFMNCKDKYSRLDKLISELKIKWSDVVYVGDDINDLSNINAVGFSISPKDADLQILNSVDLVLNNVGGYHAVREAADFILKLYERNI
jgi:YrbI family 3-deoxy-D-manno-octulosonate 8-phosphate phosphatase